jgi:CelD/BcsL family acetyltransferase involved in cellulose biosynthesis
MTEEGLSNLREDWDRLSDAAAFPNVFMSFDWFRVWNRCFAQQARRGRRHLQVLVMKRDGRVEGISPFIHRTASRFGVAVRKVEFLESESSYNDCVWGNDPVGQGAALWDFLAQTEDQWDLVDLRSIRETGNVLRLLKISLARTKLLYRFLPEKPCHYLALDAPWSEILSRRSRSTRHTLQTQQRRLESMRAEGLRIRIIEDPQNEPRLVEKMIALESQKQIKGKLVDPWMARYPEVFRSLFSELGPRGWNSVALMELGDTPVACVWAFRCGNKLWCYNHAFNTDFSRLSPGTMLDTALIDYGFAQGYEEYDFLYGEEPYKLRWCTGSHERFRLVIWSRRWISRARAYVYLDLKEAVYRRMAKGAGP